MVVALNAEHRKVYGQHKFNGSGLPDRQGEDRVCWTHVAGGKTEPATSTATGTQGLLNLLQQGRQNSLEALMTEGSVGVAGLRRALQADRSWRPRHQSIVCASWARSPWALDVSRFDKRTGRWYGGLGLAMRLQRTFQTRSGRHQRAKRLLIDGGGDGLCSRLQGPHRLRKVWEYPF